MSPMTGPSLGWPPHRAAISTSNDPIPDGGVAPTADIMKVHKLRSVKRFPVMFGVCGVASYTQQFNDAINAADWQSWRELNDAASAAVVAIDAGVRLRTEAAGDDFVKVQRPLALLAGFVDGVFDAVQVEHDGSRTSIPSMGPMVGFVGPYAGVARVAWQAAEDSGVPAPLTHSSTLRRFLNSLCTTLPGLAGPVDVWKITKGGCKPHGDSG